MAKNGLIMDNTQFSTNKVYQAVIDRTDLNIMTYEVWNEPVATPDVIAELKQRWRSLLKDMGSVVDVIEPKRVVEEMPKGPILTWDSYQSPHISKIGALKKVIVKRNVPKPKAEAKPKGTAAKKGGKGKGPLSRKKKGPALERESQAEDGDDDEEEEEKDVDVGKKRRKKKIAHALRVKVTVIEEDDEDVELPPPTPTPPSRRKSTAAETVGHNKGKTVPMPAPAQARRKSAPALTENENDDFDGKGGKRKNVRPPPKRRPSAANNIQDLMLAGKAYTEKETSNPKAVIPSFGNAFLDALSGIDLQKKAMQYLEETKKEWEGHRDTFGYKDNGTILMGDRDHIIGFHEKVSHKGEHMRIPLRNGIMRIAGRDYVFSRIRAETNGFTQSVISSAQNVGPNPSFGPYFGRV